MYCRQFSNPNLFFFKDTDKIIISVPTLHIEHFFLESIIKNKSIIMTYL